MNRFLLRFYIGFKSGLKSIGNAFDEDEKPYIKYLDLDTKDEIRKSFEEVGQSMQWAMDQVEDDPAYQRAIEEHSHYDARQNFLDDEQSNERFKHT